MKDAYYFSHDSNARNDPKIAAMMSRYGYEGYGWYWAFIETLRDQPDYKYPMNKYAIDALALLWHCDRTKAEQYISDCCHEFTTERSALMVMDEHYLWSESLSRRMSAVDLKRVKSSESANSRWSQSDGNANAMRTHNERNANAVQSQSDGNANKEKKKRVNNKKTELTKEVEDFFESVWMLYPRKEGKNAVTKEEKKEIFKIGYEKMIAAIENYKNSHEETKKNYLLMGSTFFNGRYADYLDGNYEEPEEEPIFKTRFDK